MNANKNYYGIMRKSRFIILTLFIVAAALLRLLPHPPNFSPIIAIALFGGAYFSSRGAAFIVPMIAMGLSDIFLGFHQSMPFVYASFLLIVGIGFVLKSHKRFTPILSGAVGSSILFFLVTNFGVWLTGTMYPHTFSGLLSCYAAAIPFFQNTLLSGLLYTGVLFGSFELLKRKYPSLSLEFAEA